MILSGKEIVRQMYFGNIDITPFNKNQLNPNSYNLKLYDELYVYTKYPLDMKSDNEYKVIKIPESGYMLEPNTLYLGRTVEKTFTDKFVPMLEGRSSIGRLGICIHATAGFGDVGFNGYWTLEIFCLQPVIIYPNVEICQIYYHEIKGNYDLYDKGKYNNNDGIQTSQIYKELTWKVLLVCLL